MVTATMDFKNFNPAMPVMVKTEFMFLGINYFRGQVFNWEKLDITKHKMQQLVDTGKLKPISEIKRSELAAYHYRYLQLLCRSLNIKAHGSSGEIQERLWNKIKR